MTLLILLLSTCLIPSSTALLSVEDNSPDPIQLVHQEDEERVDVLVDGELFTSYLYTREHEVLQKPVLFPLVSPGGLNVTRGYPLEPRPGERVDHPHHIGFWLNYGNVNGIDFWNNSGNPERADRMGTIVHDSVEQMESSGDQGQLVVTKSWLMPDGSTVLRERTQYIFRLGDDERIIDRITTLSALDEDVMLPDDKEGMVAVRVARELEHPTDRPVRVTGSDAQPMDEPVVDNENLTGHYISSEGVEGEEVWSTRARWMVLNGTIQNEDVSLALIDHPENPGFPTHWHARGYGLFSANPLGQEDFSNGENVLDFSLEAGESTTFRYRLVVRSGHPSADDMESHFEEFSNVGEYSPIGNSR